MQQTNSRLLGAAALLGLCLQGLLVSGKTPDFITPEIMEMLQGDKQRCMAEHGTTEALIDEVNNGHLPNDKAITCYMFCLFEAFSLVDDEANIEIEMLTGFLPEDMQETANQLFEVCSKAKGSDVCDTMYQLGKCVQDKRPDLWFMV